MATCLYKNEWLLNNKFYVLALMISSTMLIRTLTLCLQNTLRRPLSTVDSKPKTKLVPNCLKCANVMDGDIMVGDNKTPKCMKYQKYITTNIDFVAKCDTTDYEKCVDVRYDANKCGIDAKYFSNDIYLIINPIKWMSLSSIYMYFGTQYVFDLGYLFARRGDFIDVYTSAIITLPIHLFVVGSGGVVFLFSLCNLSKNIDAPNMIEIPEENCTSNKERKPTPTTKK